METFDKVVSPNYRCDSSGAACEWINEVGLVTIAAHEPYNLQPPVAPNDMAHRLLYVVDGVAATYNLCSTFDQIVDYYPNPPVVPLWNAVGKGSAAGNLLNIGLPAGFGKPDIFAFRNQITRSAFQFGGVYAQFDHDTTQYSNTIDEFNSAVESPSYGHAVTTEYWDSQITQGEYVTYIPDFTDCASGYPEDRYIGDQLYGITTAAIVVEMYQAIPQ
jgi:hypothetical protein